VTPVTLTPCREYQCVAFRARPIPFTSNTRSLSIVIDKPIPLSIGISMSLIVVNNIIVKKLSLKWNHLIWTPLNSTTFVTDEQNEFSLCPAEGEANLVAPKQHIFLTLLTEDEASK